MRFMKVVVGMAIGAVLLSAGPIASGADAPADVGPLRAYDVETRNSEYTGTGAGRGRTWGGITISRQSRGYKVVVSGNVVMYGPLTSEPGSPGPYFWAIAYAAYDYWDGHRWYHTDRHELGRDMPQPTMTPQVPTSYSKTFNSVQNFYVYVCLFNPVHAPPQGCSARV